MDCIHIDALEVAQKFGYLIKGKGKVSGLDFAKLILKSEKDCQSHREACASSVASTVYEIQISRRNCMVTEIL
jgi:hypothetical protein